MTHREILKKAIEKAIAGGWKFAGDNQDATIEVKYRDDYFGDEPYFEIDWHMPTDNGEKSVEEVIFNHEFAKALWGDRGEGDFVNPVYIQKESKGDFELDHTDKYSGPWWKYHLMQMVVADDPVKYLSEHI